MRNSLSLTAASLALKRNHILFFLPPPPLRKRVSSSHDLVFADDQQETKWRWLAKQDHTKLVYTTRALFRFFRTGFRSKIQQLTLFLVKPCLIIAFSNEDYEIFIESSLLGLCMSAKLKKNASKLWASRCAVEVVNDVKGKRLRAGLENGQVTCER